MALTLLHYEPGFAQARLVSIGLPSGDYNCSVIFTECCIDCTVYDRWTAQSMTLHTSQQGDSR